MHEAFEQMLAHPAPGIWFGAHDRAGLPARLIPTRHEVGKPAGWLSMRALRQKLSALPDRGASMLDFYKRHNGVGLCVLPDPLNGGDQPSFSLLPIGNMSDTPTEDDWFYEGAEHIYQAGKFLKIAESPSEQTTLSMVLQDGGPERPKAGKIYYLSLDPVWACDEPVFAGFDALLDRIATEPARFLSDIGYCGAVQGVGAEKGWFGDPPDRYVPDILAEPK
jgi:hypothetical protein